MKTGVLCIHGFTGGPYEVQPIADYLENNTDWKIVVPTFTWSRGDIGVKKFSSGKLDDGSRTCSSKTAKRSGSSNCYWIFNGWPYCYLFS